MVTTVPLHVTIDHDVIRAWAERRGAHPAWPDEPDRPWPLQFKFGPEDPGMAPMAWDEFFAELDRANLAFVYRDTAPDGALDDSHEFVTRARVPELTEARRSTIIEHVI